MKNKRFIAATIFLLSIWYTLPAFTQIEFSDTNMGDLYIQDFNIVDVNVAKVAAADKLPIFYPGRWGYFTRFVLYDLVGQPAAYAFVFSKEEPDANSAKVASPTITDIEASMANARERISLLSSNREQILKDSRKSVKEKNKEINEIQKQMKKAEAQLFGKNAFATVFTGAKDDMPVILKCHKGFPRQFVKKVDALEMLEKEEPNSMWQVERFLYLGRFNEAIVARATQAKEVEIPVEPKSRQVVVEMRTRTIWTIPQLKNKKVQLEHKKQQMEEKDHRLKAEKDVRTAQNKKLWEIYKQRLLRDKQLQSVLKQQKSQAIAPKKIQIQGAKQAVTVIFNGEKAIDSKEGEKTDQEKEKSGTEK